MESLAIQNCKFEEVDGNPDITIGVPLGCITCASLSYGGGHVMAGQDGFTYVVSGSCPKYDIQAQALTAQAILDKAA
jgi:hypothetical protein